MNQNCLEPEVRGTYALEIGDDGTVYAAGSDHYYKISEEGDIIDDYNIDLMCTEWGITDIVIGEDSIPYAIHPCDNYQRPACTLEVIKYNSWIVSVLGDRYCESSENDDDQDDDDSGNNDDGCGCSTTGTSQSSILPFIMILAGFLVLRFSRNRFR